MRRMPRPGQHDREMQLFVGLVARALGLAKDSSDLEEAHVSLTLAPVVLDAPDQPRKQATPKVRFFGRQRVQDCHGIRAVGWTEREGPGLEEAVTARHELFAYTAERQLRGRVGDGAGTIGPQLVREGVVAAQPRNLFDQVNLACDVGPPARNLDRHAVVLGRGDEAHGGQEPLDFLPRYRHAEEVTDARFAQKDGARLLRLGPEVDGRLTHFAPGDRADQVDGASQRVGHGEHIEPSLETIARLARQAEGAPSAPNASRLEVGGFEHNVRGAVGNFGLGTAHDAGHDRGPLGVADDGHLSRQPSAHSVQGDDLFPWLGSAHDDGRAPQLREIEGVQRLIDFEQDVVCRVDDVVDGALANALQARGQPRRTGTNSYTANHRDHVAGGALGVLELHRDSVHNGGWADGRMGGSTYHPPIRRSDDLRKLYSRSQSHRQLPGHALMAQKVRPIRRYIDQDLFIRDRHRFEKWCARRGVGLQLQDPRMVDAEAELFSGAEHAVGLDAADLAALELQPTGKRRADGSKRVGLPCLDVGSAADDFERGAARVHHAQREPVGVGMLLDLEDARDEHVAQVLMDRHDTIDGRDLAREAIGDIQALERAAQKSFQPTTRDDHEFG